MPDQDHPLAKWFGEKKIVRLMLLAALLALGVIHIESIIAGVALMWRVARPLITGAAFAYILEVVVKRLEGLFPVAIKSQWLQHSKRIICILIAIVLVMSLLVLIVSTVIPGLRQAFTVLGTEFPNYFAQAKVWIMDTFKEVPTVTEYMQNLELDWPSVQNRVFDWAINGIGGASLLSSTVTVIGAVTGSVANFFISAIFAIFLLTGKAKLQSQSRHVMAVTFDKKANTKIQYILKTSNRCFSGFIVGQTINAFILGLLTWLGMRLFGMPYALMVGVLSGTASLVPIIGGYIGAALGTFLVFTANPRLAVWFLVFIVSLQTVQGNLLYPRLVGNSVGLPALWVLAAVCVGGGLSGVAGMIVAVPITATLYALAQDWVDRKDDEKPEPPAPKQQKIGKEAT